FSLGFRIMEDKTRLLWAQALSHQLYTADLEHALTGLGQLFIVATIPPVAPQPSKGALDDPTPFDDLEALLPLFLPRYLQAEAGIRFRPRRQALIAIHMVPQHFHQTGEPFLLGPFKDDPCRFGIAHGGGRHHDSQQETHGVDQDMTLDSVDLLVAVDAVVSATLRPFDTLTVDTGHARRRLTTRFHTDLFTQGLEH